MHDPSGDLRRLFDALEEEWSLKDLTCDLSVLQMLQPALRAGGWQVTVAVHGEKQIIGVWPGLHETALGLAVDIGSTTIAAHLCDLTSGEVVASAGVMNPQIRFGEDLMSRVSYSMMNPGGAALDDRRGARGAQRPRRGRRQECRRLARGYPGGHAGRQPDHASSAARHRPGRARRRTVCARHRSLVDAAGECARLEIASQRARLCSAVHRRPRRGRRRGRGAFGAARPWPGNDAAGRCRHQRGDRARQPSQAGRLLQPHGSCLRGRADQLRAARGARSDRAGAHRPRDSRAALQGDRLGSVVG